MIHIKRISPKYWVYWGHETLLPGEKCGVAEQFFWLEDFPPYRVANGWRFKESPRDAFHVGFAKKSHNTTTEMALGGRRLEDVTPQELREWRGHGPVHQEV